MWDHPHAYGDKTETKFVLKNGAGSSPRVWGQVLSISSIGTILRIIPTRMGTSNLSLLVALLAWDHPHAYGDK